MSKLIKSFVVLCVSALLLSCTCGTPLKVTPIQKTDKKLTCKDIILEINEAEHFRDIGKRERGIGFGEALMPVCWVSGYMDGNEAYKLANERIGYLGHIYEVLDCSGKGAAGGADAGVLVPVAAPAPAATPAPAPAKPPQKSAAELEQENKIQGEADANSVVKCGAHQHTDKTGKLYVHSHCHIGPHVHEEDR